MVSDVQTIIWDLDGTLLDSFDIFVEIVSDVLPKHAIAVPSQDVLHHDFHGSLADSILASIGDKHKMRLPDIVRDVLYVQNDHYQTIEHHLFKDALVLAERAHKQGIEQIIVTNRDHEGRMNASPKYIVENSSLARYVSKVICGDESHHRKPNPRVLGDDVRVDSGTIAIGDQFVDAEFAMNLNVRAVLVNRSDKPIAHISKLGETLPDTVIVVNSLADVILG